MNPARQKEDTFFFFFAAISMADPARREAFLDDACAGDDLLRAVVAKRLSAHGEAERFFATTRAALSLGPEDLPEVSTAFAEVEMDERIGTRIGLYKVLQIGRASCRERG